jgi:hypothetical protein
MKPFYLIFLLCAVLPAVAQQTPPAPAAANNDGGSTPPTPHDPASPAELKQYPLDRYDQLVKKSPFAFEIFAQQGPAQASAFADWKLGGFTIDDGKGRVYATLVNEKSNERMVVNNQEAHKPSGIQLVQLERGKTWSESKVRLRKGAEEDVVEFSKKALDMKPTIAAAVQQQRPPTAGQPGNAPPGAAAAANRANAVQAQLNAALANQNPQPAAGGATPVPNTAAVNNANVAAGAGTTAAGQPGQTGQQGQPPARRRVILPPPATQ